ncbi:hypothetical protein SIN8267_01834 [Sinobacterium norvegicum]|uniref:Uncharacterized protein n=1 Tax=Sinobacterium norvegicum TaxID=1641715 RepID=A0ABN8EJ09_9GAMM|nr:hypothetical protein [Sinobacterium norvegicum]CAH0991720.1 hypothetical protein SIN8267_01834 [Sinobacterium norvegicum]
MHEETELLVNAIKGLKNETGIFKDYVFPVASALFTSMLGAGIAYFTIRHQENIQIEKDKMNAANKWTLMAEEARSSLIAIKGNYQKGLTANPFHRISAVPSILFHATPITGRYDDLSFIIPKASAKPEEPNKWSQITRIRSMILNYNYCLELWKQRNQIERPIKEHIIAQTGSQAYVNMNEEKLGELVSPADLSLLIDITERAIKLTDDLIIELDDFLSGFPAYARTLIDNKRLKRYGSVIKYSNNDNQLLINLIKRCPDPDYSLVEHLFGESAELIKQRHRTGYEQ